MPHPGLNDASHFDKMPGTSKTENHKLLQFKKESQGPNTEDTYALYSIQTNTAAAHTVHCIIFLAAQEVFSLHLTSNPR